MIANGMPPTVKQKIPNRYVNKQVLNRLLVEFFGDNNFEVELVSSSQLRAYVY